MVFKPSSTRLPSRENSGLRWSIVGMSMARRMRSGTGVGPGICRKCRPAVREEFFDMNASGEATSQCGQAINDSLVIDCSKHLSNIIELDVPGRRCVVEPGIVLEDLNRALRPHGQWFPVDISTASRATIGGMVGNNSCGARSLRYGNTRENVLSVDAVLADGRPAHFGPAARDLSDVPAGSPLRELAPSLLALAAREA